MKEFIKTKTLHNIDNSKTNYTILTIELSLIGHFAYRYIGRKYHDLSICIDLFINLLLFYVLFVYE